MGITAELFWRQPGVLRSDHPGASFTAAGRLAESRDVVVIAVERLRVQPLVFLCVPAERCEECDAARASVGGASRR